MGRLSIDKRPIFVIESLHFYKRFGILFSVFSLDH